MTKTERRIKFFEKFAELTEFAKQSNITFLVTCYWRSTERQQELYHDNKSKKDGLVNKSAHQDWLAIDIVVVEDNILHWGRSDKYEALGAEWKSMGGLWGGDWASLDDIYHFQWRDSLVQDTD